jgi:hypothetical protein
MRSVTARAAATAALTLSMLVASAAPAAAGPTQTPNGWCGAANMRNAGEAMTNAMAFHTDEHGDAGMMHAVAVSACRS